MNNTHQRDFAPKRIAAHWMTTVDHKRLGMLYILLALVCLALGGLEATLMRMQLIRAHNDFLSPQVFNKMFTMHGTTMIFFVAMPLVIGFATYMVPLMIGARDMAFPRLNAFSFWITAFGALVLYASLFRGKGLSSGGEAPDVGWFAYAPLTSVSYSANYSTDYWALALYLSGLGSIAAGINLVVTILNNRCKGMTLSRMPLFVWINLVMSFLLILGLSTLGAAQLMLLADRYLNAHFFDVSANGSVVLWMHFFWIFGHPEVYVLVLPAFAIASEIIPVFSRRVIFGYPMMVAATLAIGFIAMSVWAHHMFAIGMGSDVNIYFVLMTMAIAVPTGIKIFNWLATMWGGNLQFEVPMLFCVAFLFQFLFAGLTGVMLGSAPFDWQLTGSYFVVAHFHYVIVGGILFCIFGAFYYWFPKMTGRMLDRRLGLWQFWLFVIGFHLTFDFMHVPGILGMPRRIYTYEPGRGWDLWNAIITVGVFVQACSMLVFAVNLFRSLRNGQLAGDDPWDAWTLEWTIQSPPPVYNFAINPVVNSRRPLWDAKHPDDPDWKYEPAGPLCMETPQPLASISLPANTSAPILIAAGLTIVAAGLLSWRYLCLFGATIVVYGVIALLRQLFPHAHRMVVPTGAPATVSTQRQRVAAVDARTGLRHRSRLPVRTHTIFAGVKGGLAACGVLLFVIPIWGFAAHGSLWYPANLLSVAFISTPVGPAQLTVFHPEALLLALAMVGVANILIGLIYGALMPMFPRNPILLGAFGIPLLGTLVIYALSGFLNPLLHREVTWPWLLVVQVGLGAVSSLIVSRAERGMTWQHETFLQRAGMEESFPAPSQEKPHA